VWRADVRALARKNTDICYWIRYIKLRKIHEDDWCMGWMEFVPRFSQCKYCKRSDQLYSLAKTTIAYIIGVNHRTIICRYSTFVC
jgi:hypothetical protein